MARMSVTTTRRVLRATRRGSDLRRATDAILRAHEKSRAEAEARRQARRAIEVIDELVSDIEDVNLERGARSSASAFLDRVAGMPAAAGPVPDAALSARSTGELHAALMDWEEDLMTAYAPRRLDYPGLDDDEGHGVDQDVTSNAA